MEIRTHFWSFSINKSSNQSPKIAWELDTTNRCIITSRTVNGLGCNVIWFNHRKVTCTIYTWWHLFGIFELKSFRWVWYCYVNGKTLSLGGVPHMSGDWVSIHKNKSESSETFKFPVRWILSYHFYVQGKNSKLEFFYYTWNCLEVTIWVLTCHCLPCTQKLELGILLWYMESCLEVEIQSYAPHWKW